MDNILDKKSKIGSGIKEFVSSAGADGVVIGLSGGVDSSLVAYLSANALGPDNVYGMILPSPSTSRQDIDDALSVAGALKIDYGIEDISRRIESFFDYDEKNKLVRGNVASRVRMVTLYREANRRNYLVAGTSNKSEVMLGYFTKYGDGGVDFELIGNLFKTDVYEMAKALGVPENVLNKAPSAGLWPNQKDETEIGMDYNTLDRMLLMLEDRKDKQDIIDYLNLDSSLVDNVIERIDKNKHKLSMPPVITLQ